jgi:hypothetical protein
VEQAKYLGVVIHYDLGSEAAVDARLALARGALAAGRKAFSCRDLELPVRGKLMVATVLSILLYGAESWILDATLKRRLETFYNDCCRFVCRTSRLRARLSGVHMLDMRRSMEVQDFDYYLKHRMLCWAGALARQGMHRLPRKMLTCSTVERQCEPLPPTGNGGGSGRGLDDDNGEEDEQEDLRMEHSEVEDEEAVADGDDGSDEEWEDGSGYSAASLGMGGAASGGGGGGVHSQVGGDSDADSDGGDGDGLIGGGGGGGRGGFSVETAVRDCKCAVMGSTIPARQLRIKRVHRRLASGGLDVPYYTSLVGFKKLLVERRGLRRRLARGRLGGLNQLDPADRTRVVAMLRPEAVEEARREMMLYIDPPVQTPWTCNRCGKQYKKRISAALRHAEDGNCRRRRRRVPVVGAAAAARKKKRVYGKRRNLSWLKSVHGCLRKQMRSMPVAPINTRPWGQCRSCRQAYMQCERCFFLEWMGVAQDAAEWGKKVVYFTADNDNSATARSRRAKQRAPDEPWCDPRPVEAASSRVRTLSADAAAKWGTSVGRVMAAIDAGFQGWPASRRERLEACAAVLHGDRRHAGALAYVRTAVGTHRGCDERYRRAILREAEDVGQSA